jgi:antitoxin component HigA of HigAB toxin-antitoxin module
VVEALHNLDCIQVDWQYSEELAEVEDTVEHQLKRSLLTTYCFDYSQPQLEVYEEVATVEQVC